MALTSQTSDSSSDEIPQGAEGRPPTSPGARDVRRVPPWGRAILLVFAVTAGWVGGTLGGWLAGAAGCLLAWDWLAGRPQVLRARQLPTLLVVIVFLALCGPLCLGDPPASRDHGIHFFQTQIVVQDLLPHALLRGWTPRINHGIPIGDGYPTLGYGLAGLAHLLTFQAIPLRVSYALFMAALWAASMWSVGALAAEIARNIDDPRTSRTNDTAAVRWAAAIAALAWCIDPGSSREGGWNYLMFHGVWPQQLSVCLWCAGTVTALRVWRRPTVAGACTMAMLLGACILAHPFGLLAACILPPAFVLAAIAASEPAPVGAPETTHHTSTTAAVTLALSLGFAGAAMLAAGNLAVLFASAGSLGRSPVPWDEFSTLAARLWSGELFGAQHASIGAAAAVGLLATIKRRARAGLVVLFAIAGIFVVGARDAVTVLRLDLVIPALKNVQFIRWTLFLKPLWYALAGVGGVSMIRSLRMHGAAPRPPSMAARVALCLALGPLVSGGITGLGHIVQRPVGGLHTLRDAPYAREDAALREALAQAQQSLGETPLRVAFLREGMTGGTFPLFAIADAHAHLVMDGHVPAINFQRRVRAQDPGLLRSLGVTHILFDRPPDDERAGRLLQSIGPGTTIGEYTLAPLTHSAGAPIVKNGVMTWTERDTLRVRANEPGGIVMLPIAPYRKWAAQTPAGDPVDIDARLYRRGLTGMQLSLPEGVSELTLRYQTPRAEILLSRSVTVAWVCVVLLALWARHRGLPIRLVRGAPSVPRRAMMGLVGVAGLALLVTMIALQRQQLTRTWRAAAASWDRVEDDDRFPTVRDLIIDDAWTLTQTDALACDGMKTRNAQAGCVPGDAEPTRSSLYAAPFIYRCLRLEVPAQGWASLSLPAPGPRETLELIGARVARTPRTRARAKLSWQPTRETGAPHKLRRVSRVSVPHLPEQTRVEVKIVNEGAAPGRACVAAALVSLPE